jgi:hypothetical protein
MRFTLLLCTVFAATPCLAADPPTIEKLIEQLGSRSFPERERATKALHERGPAALPALRKALETKDEEVRRRVESLIPGLEIEEALLPKTVTLNVDKQNPNDVLKEIEKQTGYKVTGPITSDPLVTLNFREVPFWDAIDRLGNQTNRRISRDDFVHSKSIQLQSSHSASPHVNIRGPFRLEATRFHEDRDLDFTQAKPDSDGWRHHRLTLAVSVYAEPRITFLRVEPAKVTEALDDEGKSLLEQANETVEQKLRPDERGTFRGEFLSSSDVRLRRASESAKTAKLIRGTIPVKAIVIRKNVVITNKLADSTGTSFRAGTDSLQITRIGNQGGGSIEVQILVPFNNGANNDSWHQRFHVEDDEGNRFQDHGRGSSSDGRQQWISLYYGPPFNNNKKKVGPPTKLIFEDWIVHDHLIPFEFKDVKLP